MKIFLYVMLFLALLLAIWGLAPNEKRIYKMTDLPWQIVVEPNGNLSVFDLTIGESVLQAARDKLATPASIGILVDPNGEHTLEAYFEGVTLAGLNANLVFEVEATQQQLKEMVARNVNRDPTPSGAVKYEITEDDLRTITQWKIHSISYMPKANLDEDIILHRFGESQEKVTLKEGVVYWLYPAKGLAIMVDEDGRDLLQYVRPADFLRIRNTIAAQQLTEAAEKE